MKIGVNFPAGPRSTHPAAFARSAEALGFESIWMGEHPVVPLEIRSQSPQLVDGDLPEAYRAVADPLICLAQAAAVTEQLRLGTGVCLVTERNPLLLAKELATLDHYSGGRAILGAGAGWLREELAVMGSDYATRWIRLRESVEAMRALWRDDEAAEYHGEVIDFPAVRCRPKPLQRPGVPVLVGAAGARGIAETAAWGDGWYPMPESPQALRRDLATLAKACEAGGRDIGALDITALVGLEPASASVDTLRAYEEAGATRVVVAVQTAAGALDPLPAQSADATLELLARRLL